MAGRIEWRNKGKGKDALLFVGEYGEAGDTVIKAWPADARLIADFMNDMTSLDIPVQGLETEVDQRSPEQWGELVMTRTPDGDVLYIEPEGYWDAVYYYFRAYGRDPHPWVEQHAAKT